MPLTTVRAPPPPARRPPAIPAVPNTPHGTHANGGVPGPHSRIPAPTARGQRTPTTRSKSWQPGEDERLTSDALHIGSRHLPCGCPPATPTARNAGLQERTLWGWCWVPTFAPPTPTGHCRAPMPAHPRPRQLRRPKQLYRSFLKKPPRNDAGYFSQVPCSFDPDFFMPDFSVKKGTFSVTLQ